MTKQEKKDKKIITLNHKVTIDRRERSFEGLASQLETGEDGIYGLIAEDKNIIFCPKTSITEQDIKEIPGLADLRAEILKLEAQIKTAKGRQAFLYKKQLIEMRQDQYVLKAMYHKPIYSVNLIKSLSHLDLGEEVDLGPDGTPQSTGLINLYSPRHISLLLCNYSRIKQDCWSNFNSDIKWLMEDLDNLIDETLKPKKPIYFDILTDKIDSLSNIDIQQHLSQKWGKPYSPEYISHIWRNKIPSFLAQEAADKWLYYHYTFETKGKWKKCSRCGQIKLAHTRFFSKNSTSKDGLYSICKECRRKH